MELFTEEDLSGMGSWIESGRENLTQEAIKRLLEHARELLRLKAGRRLMKRRTRKYKHFAWFVRQMGCWRPRMLAPAPTCLGIPGSPDLCPSCLARRWFPDGIKPRKGWER